MDETILERYRGRVVGTDAVGKVVADAAELDELLDKLDAFGIVGVTSSASLLSTSRCSSVCADKRAREVDVRPCRPRRTEGCPPSL
jgi:hypothetical protein